jgi:Fe-S cluster assembly protein SufD
MSTLASYPGVTLPTTEEEIWRYSRIEELVLDKYVAGKVATTIVDQAGALNAQGRFGDCGIAMPIAVDAFAEISAIQSDTANADILTVTVPKGKVFDAPIVITRTVDKSGVLATPRLVIDAGENSEVTVVERFVSADDIDSLVIPVVEMRAAQAARITYMAINELGRVRTEARLVGPNANTQQVALYFADGDQMHDFRTLQTHVAPRTHSDLLFKGAVQDTAKSVYTGLIRIEKDANGSQAYQTNRNLTLSEGAWAESVPNLEIETNDVKCSHASTVGPIDNEQRFYLESRGIRPEIAERLVVLGFFNEVLERLPKLDIVSDLQKKVADKLASNGGAK